MEGGLDQRKKEEEKKPCKLSQVGSYQRTKVQGRSDPSPTVVPKEGAV
jgi:hypothetical protein